MYHCVCSTYGQDDLCVMREQEWPSIICGTKAIVVDMSCSHILGHNGLELLLPYQMDGF